MSNFVHLHNHSDYSLLDGAASISRYIEKAKSVGMKSLALTDHGNMFGAIEFYRACKAADINPIIGCEFYVAPESRKNRSPIFGKENYYHLILLAMNSDGYKNLIKLNSIAWKEGQYHKPRIDREALEEYSDNLICLSACVAGEVPRMLLGGANRAPSYEKAKEVASYYKNLFGDRYYLELQDHGLREQREVNPQIIKLARELDIPLVCTNDIHYIEKDDWDAHDTLLCIGTGKKKKDPDRLRYKEGEFYFRTPEEMEKLFSYIPEAIENTGKIAARCNIEIDFPGGILPVCDIPPEFKSDGDYLIHLAYEGLKVRYPNASEEEYKELKERLDYELGVIISMDFPSYFLIVRDYIHWAKTVGDVPVGPGRGSGAGSLVAYCITITNVDPIKYGLLFERFLNPERVNLPDFDVDFCYEGRSKVIEYVTKKYGYDSVGQIVTFGTLKPKAVLKDVARVLDIPFEEANKISSLVPAVIPDVKKIHLTDALNFEPKLKAYRDRGGIYEELFDEALRLEGLSRHTSLHAAGIVIGREPLDTYVPLCTDNKGNIATQYTMTEIENCGLVKMDFLGLKTLTLIKHTLELIRKKDPDFDIDKIDEQDKKTFDMLKRGDSSLVFQFESEGMQDVLKRAQPENIEELVALNALYRPGPMDYIPQYIDAKFGRIPIKYPDPCLEELLKPTYGVIVYQEQVMKVAQIIAGYSLGAADQLRRIMGKKKVDKLAEELVKFKKGAVEKGFSAEHAEEIFNILKPFANYGFNKSHAVAYSIIAYQTAYLKANYLAEFLAANLTNEIGSPDKFKFYLNLIPKYGLKIVPPSINRSFYFFNVDNGEIIYGLAGIKNVGQRSVELITEEREKNGPYKDFVDFVIRQQDSCLNTSLLESLIKSGAFDELGTDRAVLLANMEDVLKFDKSNRNLHAYNQMSLFDAEEDSILNTFTFKDAPSWPEGDKLKAEKELLGFYISGHPLESYKERIEQTVSVRLDDLDTIHLGESTQIIAQVIEVKQVLTKKKERMAIFKLQTLEGETEAVIFPKNYTSLNLELEIDGIYGFIGQFKSTQKDDGSFNFVLEKVVHPNELEVKKVKNVNIRLKDLPEYNKEVLYPLLNLLQNNSGFIPITLSITSHPEEELCPEIFKIEYNNSLYENLISMDIVDNVWTN